MENEIKVGDFIRTAQGTIAQIEEDEFEIKTNVRGQILYEKWIEGNRYYEVIVKHSPNIIDLVQCGDVVKVLDNGSGCEDKIDIYDEQMLEAVKEDIINNDYVLLEIYTKEMMESISYKVKTD